MKIWFREWKENHMIRDLTVEDGSGDTRTHKIFHAIDRVAQEFDLAHPIWLESTIRDFKKQAKCRFTRDNFQDEVPFDYLEMEVLEEDD